MSSSSRRACAARSPAGNPTGSADTMRAILLCATFCVALFGCAAPAPAPAPLVDRAALERQVADTERAFAKTMADRDLAAFSSFLSHETVFFSGPTPLRGKQAVTEWWKRFYDKPQAPFSWKPERARIERFDTVGLPRERCLRRLM